MVLVACSMAGRVARAAAPSCGAIDLHQLQAGESVTVDSGHLVADDDTIDMRDRTAGGISTAMKSGEAWSLN